MKPALFLDRDGVINVDHGYVHRVEQFDFMDGIFELCRLARARGYSLFVVTNQAGIGRGYYTEEAFHALTRWMLAEFERHGAPITQVYFCPDHPTHGVGPYRRHSPMRKPGPGMVLKAAQDHGLDLARSVLLGDNLTDIQAGEAAGVGACVRFEPGHVFSPEEHMIGHLSELAHWLPAVPGAPAVPVAA
nr:HAD family hydrolase [Variovorax boronicumulans]